MLFKKRMLIFLVLGLGILAIVLSVTLHDTTIITTPTPTVTVSCLTVTPTPCPTCSVCPFQDNIILYDTFTEAGSGFILLSAHTPEIGGPWEPSPLSPTSELQLILGGGYVTNTTTTLDVNESCVCNYDNLTKTLVFTLRILIPSTITSLGGNAALAFGFLNETTQNGMFYQFYYNPFAGNYRADLFDAVGGSPSGVIDSKTIAAIPPLDQSIIVTGTMDANGYVSITLFDLTVSATCAYSPAVDNLNRFPLGLQRSNALEAINIHIEDILIQAI